MKHVIDLFGNDDSRQTRSANKVRQRQFEEARKAGVANAARIKGLDTLRVSDFRELSNEIPDNSVELIFTDPPYDRKSVGLYGDLARIASRVLIPGGSLVCYCGHYLMHDVLSLMVPFLKPWWVFACHHSGRSSRMVEYGVVVTWKPLIWFVKNTRGDKQTFIEDSVCSSPTNKAWHKWQQSEKEAEYFIEKLTQEKGLVLDPFCGGGTTAYVAKHLNRHYLSCDTDHEAIERAKERLYGRRYAVVDLFAPATGRTTMKSPPFASQRDTRNHV